MHRPGAQTVPRRTIAVILFCAFGAFFSLWLLGGASSPRPPPPQSEVVTAEPHLNTQSHQDFLPAVAHPLLKANHLDKLFKCNLPRPTLFAGRQLLFLAADVLNQHKVLWWLDSGSIVGPMRMNVPLPWDDDADIFIDADDFYEKRDSIHTALQRHAQKWNGDMWVELPGWYGPGGGPGKPSTSSSGGSDRNWHQCPGGNVNMPRIIFRLKNFNGAPVRWHTSVMDIFLTERVSPRSCQLRQTCREPWVFSLFLMSLTSVFDPVVVKQELQAEQQRDEKESRVLCQDNGSILVYNDTIRDLHVPVPNLRPELSLRKFAPGGGGLLSTMRMFRRDDFPVPHNPNEYLFERFHSKRRHDYINSVAFSGIHDEALSIDFAAENGTPEKLRQLCCSWGFLGPDKNHPKFSAESGHCPEGFVNDVRLAPELAARFLITALKGYHADVSVPISKATAPFDVEETAMFKSACRNPQSLDSSWRACGATFAADPELKLLHREIFNVRLMKA